MEANGPNLSMDTSPSSIGRVYALFDPRTSEDRYVGETTCELDHRRGLHMAGALSGIGKKGRNSKESPLADWIAELASLNVMPGIRPLEEIPLSGDVKVDKRARWEAERRWRKLLRQGGASLLNRTPGVPKGYMMGPSKLRGRKRPNVSQALIGRSLTPEQGEALARGRKRRWDRYRELNLQDDPEARARRSAAALRAWETRRSKAA